MACLFQYNLYPYLKLKIVSVTIHDLPFHKVIILVTLGSVVSLELFNKVGAFVERPWSRPLYYY